MFRPSQCTFMTSLMICAAILVGCASGPEAGSTRTLSSKPDVVAYCHESFMERIDLGQQDQSHGDLVTWSADVFDSMPTSRDRTDGKPVGLASGYMVVTHPNHEVNKPDHEDREFRLSTMTMEWDDSDDSIIFMGLHAYAHGAPRLDNQVSRPIIGGTGRFLGQSGVAVVTPEGEAWFRVDIYLAK